MIPRLFPEESGLDNPSADGPLTLDNDTWLTPRWILDQLGEFDLDPCAAACKPMWTRAKCCVYPSPVPGYASGLDLDWQGRVFMNPPFSDIAPWVQRMAEHGDGIALLPAGHETEAWDRYVWRAASSVLLLRGRVRFIGPDGLTIGGRPRRAIALVSYDSGQCLSCLTARNAEILSRFGDHGVYLDRWSTRPSVPPLVVSTENGDMK